MKFGSFQPVSAIPKLPLRFCLFKFPSMNLFVGILVLLICCIGNAEWWVILINRRHALKFRHAVLNRIRKLHDLGITVIPMVLIGFVGFTNDGLFTGGSWSTLSWAQQALVATTALGFIPFVIGVLRFQLRKLPAGYALNDSIIKKPLANPITDQVRESMYGEASRFIRRFPGNQIWQLEVNRKSFAIQKPKQASSSLNLSDEGVESSPATSFTVAHFSDVHLIGQPGAAWQKFLVDELIALQPDAFVFTGDLLDQMDWLPFVKEQFERISKTAPAYFILGNHDWHLDFEAIRSTLENAGWTDLGQKHVTRQINGCKVMLAGTEAPWIGENPEVPPHGSEDLRILLSHSPDQRDYAVDNQFDLMLSGHNHGGQITLPIIGPVYSPSQFGVRYAGGCFEHKQMLMHVSRGTGSKDPLRFRCPPEISLLQIRSVDNNQPCQQ